ncbi:hypothetical protein BDR06DRAFT_1003882 [Suillus hirtellus]|nr:hypothetical protein BDR06DRAFT_1003882 [Suillus hirtellus]
MTVSKAYVTVSIWIIAGVTCYVAIPTVYYAKDKVIIILPDAFGILVTSYPTFTKRYKPHNGSSLMTYQERL